MSENLPKPRDRLDQLIYSAIEAENYKQALKLVDKRLAKKQDEFLQALKCYIQAQHPTLSERNAAAIALQELVGKQIGLTDLGALDLYDEASATLCPPSSREPIENLGKLRLFAVKAKPKDEDFVKKCLGACLRRDDLANSQQIAVLMETNFSENRNYPFWSIAIMALFAQSSSCPVGQRKMYSRLSYGKLKKMALATTEIAEGETAPPRSIQKPQELKLLYEVVKKEAGMQELLGLLQSSALGPYSKAAKGEWEFVRAKISTFEELHMWQELFDTCDSILAKAHAKNDAGVAEDTRGGDWSVWKAYIRSANMLKDQKLLLGVHQTLMIHLSPEAGLDKTYRRNAHLAMLSFTLDNPQPCETYTVSDGENFKIENVPTSVSALFTYLHEYSENPSAYGDVSAHIESLTTAERKILLEILKRMLDCKIFVLYSTEGKQDSEKSHATVYPIREHTAINRITSRLTVSKITYLIKISIPESARRAAKQYSSQWTCDFCAKKSCEIACKACLTEVLNELLPIYKDTIEDKTLVGLLPTDTHPADDFYVLAATCLLKLAGFRPPVDSDIVDVGEDVDMAYVTQAVALLEYASSRSKVNPEILLLLVRLYSFMGAGTLAMRVYKRLRIKQVQVDTLGYTIFDRISSLHPHTFTQFEDDLSETKEHDLLLEHQRFYKNVRSQITKNAWRSLEHGSYNTIFGLVEVSDHLSRSVAAAMSVLELRRINRITRKEAPLHPSSYGYDVLPSQPELVTQWHDNSDYLSFPNFEAHSAPRFETFIRLGPAPSSLRCRAFLMIEKLLILTTTASKGLTTRSALQEEVETCVLAIEKLDSELLEQKVFTSSEKEMVQTSFNLFRLLHTSTTPQADNKAPSEPTDTTLKINLRTTILESLSKQTHRIISIPSTQPALFTTHLHPLYTTHELATNILTISTFNPDFLSPKTKTKPPTPFITEDLVSAAQNLKKNIAEKATAMKKRSLEGGALNRVIEAVVGLEGSAWDEVWLEAWAGELVGSWEEAVEGLVGCTRV